MLDYILDALFDSLKLLPFLYLTYLLIEFIEHKAGEGFSRALTRLGRFGSLAGAALGCVPQCGFSIAASNLYAGRVIGLGTLAAVFISTSDEALPVLLAHPESYGAILPLLGIKLVLAVIIGLLIDLVLFRSKSAVQPSEAHEQVHGGCDDDCCKRGIWLSALKHTLSVYLFVLAVMLLFNMLIYFLGEQTIAAFVGAGRWYSPILAALVGFIPNCASSVILTELYTSELLSFGALVAGLVTNTGIGLLTLARFRSHRRTALVMAGALLLVGLLAGFAIQLLGF